MERALRRWAARLPLLLAFGLSARAEVPVRSGELPEPEERQAEALANAARGLLLSGGAETAAPAREAFEEAIRLDPSAREPYRLLARHLDEAGLPRDRAAVLAREARAFGGRDDWRRALAAAVAAGETSLAREAAAALSARALERPSDPGAAADLGAVAIALCRAGEAADAVHPFRRYLERARDPALVPPDAPPRVFVFCVRALLSVPDRAEADKVRDADALFRLVRGAVLPARPRERADALGAAAASVAGASAGPAAADLFRRMALEALRLAPDDVSVAFVLALRGGEEDGDGGTPPDDASGDDAPARIAAFAARPEAAGLGYSFALARAVAAAARAGGPDAAAATNALAEAEALWRADRPGEPLPPDHAGIRLETMLKLGFGAAALEDALRGLPEDLRGLEPSFANNLAYTLACEGGDLDLAMRLADRSLALRPDSPEALDTLGWIFHLRGDDGEALEMLHRSMRLLDARDRGSAEVFDHAGDVLAALGRDAEALAAWTAAWRLERAEAVADKLRARGFDPEKGVGPAGLEPATEGL